MFEQWKVINNHVKVADSIHSEQFEFKDTQHTLTV